MSGRTVRNAERGQFKSEGASQTRSRRALSDGAAGDQGGLLGEKGNDGEMQKDLK